MAKNVVREDVVQIEFVADTSPLDEISEMITSMRKDMGVFASVEDGLGEVGKSAENATDGMSDLQSTIQDIAKSGVDDLNGGMEDLLDTVEDIAKTDIDDLGDGLDKIKKQTEQTTKSAKQQTKQYDDTRDSLTGMARKMAEFVNIKVGNQFQKLKNDVYKVAFSFKNIKANGLKGLLRELDVGLLAALKGVNKLKNGFLAITKISLKTAISQLTTITKLSAKGIGKGFLGFGKVITKTMGKAVNAVKTGMAAITAALGMGVAAVFNYGSSYETGLAKTSTLLDQNVLGIDDLSGQILKLSNETGAGADGLQEATYQALSAGANATGVVDLVGTAVKAAKGGYTDTTTAIDGLTSTLNAYGMATADAEGLANSFLITQNKGKTTFGELASGIGGVAPTANAAGMQINDLLGSIAALTANGIGTSEAMTGVKATLSNIIKPSAEAAETAKSLGIDFSTAAIKSKGWTGFLAEIKQKTGGSSDTMAKLFGSVEALNAVLTLTSDNGGKLLNDTLSEMGTNTTALDDAYNTMADTAAGSVERAKNSFKNLGISIYQDNKGIFADMTKLFADTGNDLYNAFTKGGMSGLSKQFGKSLSNIIVAIADYVPSFIDAGVDMINSLVKGIMKNSGKLASAAAKSVTKFVTGAAKLIPKVLLSGADLLLGLANGVINNLPKMLNSGEQAVGKLVSGIMQRLPDIMETGRTLVSTLVTYILEKLPDIISSGITMLLSFVEGIVSYLPYLIETGIALIQSLTGALLSKLPDIITAGITLLLGLVAGITEMLPYLMRAATDLLISFVLTLVDNLPAILETGISFILTLLEGIFEAVPKLIGAIPQIIGGIIEGFFSVNWIEVGVKILGSIASGLWNGIKSLFGLGEAAAEEVTAGIESGTPSSGTVPINTEVDIKVPTTDEIMKKMDLPSDVTKGVDAKSLITIPVDADLPSTDDILAKMKAEGLGGNQEIAKLLEVPVEAKVPTVKEIKSKIKLPYLSQDEDVKAKMTVPIKTETPTAEEIIAGMQLGAVGKDKELSKMLAVPVEAPITIDTKAVVEEANLIGTTWDETMTKMNTSSKKVMGAVKGAFSDTKKAANSISFVDVGVNLMEGLRKGINSKLRDVIQTSAAVAKSIKKEMNKTLDIHSPSKETEKTGKYAALGVVQGMQNTRDDVEKEAKNTGSVLLHYLEPEQANYTPESSTYRSSSAYTDNRVDANFSVNINGNTNDRDTERKVKKWVKEAFKELLESMSRTSSPLQEV